MKIIMNNKDVEKKLKESVENIEVRDFSLVWNDIKGEIKEEKSKNARKIPKWIPAIVSTAACLILIGSVAVPIAMIQPNRQETPTRYHWEDLESRPAQISGFYEQLQAAEIEYVDFDKYDIFSCALFVARDGSVRGGIIELADDVNNPSFLLTAQFYDDSVEVTPTRPEYNFNYSINEAIIKYRVKEFYPEDGGYIYDIRASKGTTNYFMEYTCFNEDIKPFLSEFFK